MLVELLRTGDALKDLWALRSPLSSPTERGLQ